jgi:hypothetical protein
MQGNRKVWETQDILLGRAKEGEEGYETGFEEVIIWNNLAIVHGRHDVVALNWKEGEELWQDGRKKRHWHFPVPLGFEIQNMDLCGELLILCGRSSTIGLSVKTGKIVWEESEVGEVPQGWKSTTIADFADLNPESWSKETVPTEIEYVDLASTKWGRIETTQKIPWIEAPSRAQRILRPGDSIIGTVRPGNGSYALVGENGLTGSTGFAVLRPRTTAYMEFVYLAATARDNIDWLSHLADGGAYPAVRPDVIASAQIVRPNDLVIEQFSVFARPLLAKVAANERESRTLATIRDTLLPKLMSGEVTTRLIQI